MSEDQKILNVMAEISAMERKIRNITTMKDAKKSELRKLQANRAMGNPSAKAVQLATLAPCF